MPVSRHCACAACAATIGRAGWSRNRRCRRRFHLAAVSSSTAKRGANPSPPCPASSGCRSIWSVARRRKRPSSAFRSSRFFPTPTLRSKPRTGAKRLNREQSGLPRRARDQEAPCREIGVLCDVALDPYTSHGHDGVLVDGYVANDETLEILVQPGAGPGRSRLRHHRAVRHDGRPRRRHPRRAGRATASRTRSSWPMPPNMRRAFYGPFRDAVGSAKALKRRQAHLSDGSGQWRRSLARSGARHRRRRRHGDGQAGHALSRPRAAREGDVSACRPSPIRCRANTRC